MKRVFSALVVILLVATCVVPVMASESYDFEWWEVSYLPDFVGELDGQYVDYLYHGALPAGLYDVYIPVYGSDVPLVLSDVSITLEQFDGSTLGFIGEYPFFSDGFSFTIALQIVVLPDEPISACLVFVKQDGDDYQKIVPDIGSVLRFVPVADQSQLVLDSMSTLSVLMSSGVQLISGNWYTVLLLALSLLGLGAVVIRKLKRP